MAKYGWSIRWFVGWVDGDVEKSNEEGDALFCMLIGWGIRGRLGFLWSVTFGSFGSTVCAEVFSGSLRLPMRKGYFAGFMEGKRGRLWKAPF